MWRKSAQGAAQHPCDLQYTGVTGHLLQSLHRAGWTAEQRQVACSHPQRIAAVNAAAAAAADIGSNVGGSIGYSIAFEDIGTKV
jgi:HrpA-like RNA helicase